MKCLRARSMILALVLSTVSVQAEENAHLWILSGQSNACGRAKLPGPKGIPKVTHFDPKSGKFVVAQDPLPGMGTTGVGPWVAAAQEVASHGIDIQTVGFASGGKPIQFWNPGKPGDKGLFPRIEQAGQQAGVFLWYQGESNSGNPAEVKTYQADLKKLVARIRKAAKNPNMTVVVVQLGAYTRKDDRDFMGMREAQRQFVIEDGNAVLVPAFGRPLKDAVHLNNPGYQELGREIGRALLRTKYKKEVNWPGPVLDAAVLSDDKKTLVAHFAEVDRLAGCFAYDFVVVDADGVNPCIDGGASNTLVTLTLKRTIALPAKLVYGYGSRPRASLVDEAGNRAPAVQIAVTQDAIPGDVTTSIPNGAGESKQK